MFGIEFRESGVANVTPGSSQMFIWMNPSRGAAHHARVAGANAVIGSRRGARAWRCLLLALLAIGSAQAQEYGFTTITGGVVGDYGQATNANVSAPTGVAFDAQGNLYVSEFHRQRIRKVSPSGVITTLAGTGATGHESNAKKARLATMNGPLGIATDAAGNVYFSDSNNNLVRKVMPGGVISTVAGTGTIISGGDGGPATSAGIVRPYGLAFDAGGNLYVAENLSHRIRMISPAGVISTFAGNGVAGFSGDGGDAIDASLNEPAGLAFDAAGNLYVADSRNHRVRRITSGGVINTVAGNGVEASSGDGGPATSAAIAFPYALAVDAGGSLYVGDFNCVLRKVVAGTISTVAGGDASCIYNGDGGPALAATVDIIEGMAIAPNGELHFADSGNYRVRKISAGGTISTVAGVGSVRNGSAANAIYSMTMGLDVDGAGNVYLADTYANHRIRKLTPAGVVSTFAGTGEYRSFGDGGPATSAGVAFPTDVTVDPAGNVYIADRVGDRIRRVATDGTIVTVAGNGAGPGYSGDDGQATDAQLNRPRSVALDAAGNLYIADQRNHRVRKVTPGGIITTFAGNGVDAFAGDGGVATDASLSSPQALAFDAAGNLYIADHGNLRVRMVTPGGIISTFAGNGTFGYGGDGGPATAATLARPTGIAFDASGNLFIAGVSLRKVTPGGTISTIRGLRNWAYDVAVGGNGALYVTVLGGRVLKGTPLPVPTRKPF